MWLRTGGPAANLNATRHFGCDRPSQWGSKRTGPDLHRVGGKYSDEWHRIHMNIPLTAGCS